MSKIRIINNTEELLAVLAEDNEQMITTPQNAIRYMGLAYIEQMLAEAFRAYPQVYQRFLLNVSDDAAICHQALKGGIKHILFTGSEEMFLKLKNIADGFETVLYFKDY